MLVQRRHFNIGAEADGAGIRRPGAGQHVDQRGLAHAVWSDDADAVAAPHADRKALDDLSVAVRSADVFRLDHELAGLFRFRGGKVGIVRGAAKIPPLLAQGVEIAEPFDVALAAPRDAVAQPVFLVDDSAVELVLIALFLRQHLVAPGLERAKAAVDLPDLAAIEPGGGARQVREETAVGAGDDKRAAAGCGGRPPPIPGGGGRRGWRPRPPRENRARLP